MGNLQSWHRKRDLASQIITVHLVASARILSSAPLVGTIELEGEFFATAEQIASHSLECGTWSSLVIVLIDGTDFGGSRPRIIVGGIDVESHAGGILSQTQMLPLFQLHSTERLCQRVTCQMYDLGFYRIILEGIETRNQFLRHRNSFGSQQCMATESQRTSQVSGLHHRSWSIPTHCQVTQCIEML